MASEEPKADAAPAAAEADATTTPKADETVLNAVVERLEFFFSDANIRQDKWMRNLLMDSDTKSVPVESLLNFNTIKQHTTDANVLIQAAQSEHLQDRLQLTDDKTCIRLKQPFTKERMNENIPLTLVVDNLPLKKGDNNDNKTFYAVTIDDVKALFQPYGKVVLVKFRFGFKSDTDHNNTNDNDAKKKSSRSPSSKNKGGPRVPLGSAFVEFADQESQTKAATNVLTQNAEGETVEPKRSLELKGQKLTVVNMQDFLDKSKQDRKRKANDNGEGDEKDEKDEKEGGGGGDDKDGEDTKGEEEEVTFTLEWKPGCVIKLDGLSDSCDREALLDAVSKGLDKSVADVKALKIYVDFSRGQTHGAIRFQTPQDGVETVLKKLQAGDVKVCNQAVEKVVLLEGDEETKYWNDFIEFKKKQIRQSRSSHSSGGGGRRKKKRRS